MSKKNILFINGIADSKKMIISSIGKEGAPNFAISGSANVKKFIQGNLIDASMVTFDANPKQDIDINPGIDAIFNQISDADSHKVSLSKAADLYRDISDIM